MKENFGDNIIPFPQKKEGQREEGVDPKKKEMLEKLDRVMSALQKIGVDVEYLESFRKKIEGSEKISDDDKRNFEHGMKIAESILRERSPEEADRIFGPSNVA